MSCSRSSARLGEVGFGLGLTGKLGRAWVVVHGWCMVFDGVAGPCMGWGMVMGVCFNVIKLLIYSFQ